MIIRYVLFLLLFREIVGLTEVAPERPSMTYINHDYLEWANFTISRYGRRSAYYLNIEGKLKLAWGNNVTLQFLFFERLSNEYRRSFVGWKFKMCDGVRDEPIIGHLLARGGLKDKTCPYEPGAYHLTNLTVDLRSVNSIWPFEKAKMEFRVFKTENNITICTGEIYLTFKTLLNGKKN